MKRNTKRKNEGITLIALVITIIVLLILAGVTIATLMGDSRNYNKGTRSKAENRRCSKRRRGNIIRFRRLYEWDNSIRRWI